MKTSDLNSSALPHKAYKYFDLVMVLFVTVLIVSNIASSAKIVDWGISLFNRLPLSFDAGTLLFPISYIFGDILTEVYGYKSSRRVIWAGFSMLAMTSLVFALVRIMPGETGWQHTAGQAAYDQILGGISSGGIALASLGAFFAGEFSNSYVLAKLKLRTRGRWLWMRTIGSTLVGEAIDSLIFVSIATLTGVFSPEIFWGLTISNYIFKVMIEVIMTPATYWIIYLLKKWENEDYYDWNTDFNPFGK